MEYRRARALPHTLLWKTPLRVYSRKKGKKRSAKFASFPNSLKTVNPLQLIAKVMIDWATAELNTTATALALAWIAKNPNTSTVILGASKPQQVIDNLKALEVLPKLTPDIMEKIEKILGNKPKEVVRWSFTIPRITTSLQLTDFCSTLEAGHL